MSKTVENQDKIYLKDPFNTELTIEDLDREMLENGDWTLLEFINWTMIESNDLKVRYDKAMKRYAEKYNIIGTKWTCPRCGEIHTITKDGINHTSNKGGFHFIRWTVDDLVEFKKWEQEELKKIKLYE